MVVYTILYLRLLQDVLAIDHGLILCGHRQTQKFLMRLSTLMVRGVSSPTNIHVDSAA